MTSLLARSQFVVAHRGSGDNWPEHTLTAYRSSLAAGADAVEISVCATSDGVLVCHHDVSGLRVLGVDRPIAEMSWSEIEELQVDARRWLGPNTPLEPVSRVEDVFGDLGDEALIFIEDKQGTNTSTLLDLLDQQPRSHERFVWKQWAGAAQIAVVQERGYASWGYFDDAQADRVEEFAQTFDVLGIPVSSSDELVTRVVAAGKPVMAWEVHYRADVERLAALGVAGMMCSNVAYLGPSSSPADMDSFATGRRAAGDLPADFDRIGWAAQPVLVPERAALRIQRSGTATYLMGSLADPGRQLSSATFSLGWPEAVPPTGRAGVALGLTSDAPGGDGDRGDADGYELSLDGAGSLELRARIAGVTSNLLGSTELGAVTAGSPVTLTVSLDQSNVIVSRGGESQPVLTVADARWRGSWIRLFKDYESSQALEFSAIEVAAV